ncbi:hypothetical protein C1X65_06025 [Pseudomonas sp. FW305-70]|nr:hypothetical protein C1X65_06025 [Pseudomonas sp. FW305-70]
MDRKKTGDLGGRNPVGASLLAMVVNDDAGRLNQLGALGFFASNRTSTGCSYSFSADWPPSTSGRASAPGRHEDSSA